MVRLLFVSFVKKVLDNASLAPHPLAGANETFLRALASKLQSLLLIEIANPPSLVKVTTWHPPLLDAHPRILLPLNFLARRVGLGSKTTPLLPLLALALMWTSRVLTQFGRLGEQWKAKMHPLLVPILASAPLTLIRPFDARALWNTYVSEAAFVGRAQQFAFLLANPSVGIVFDLVLVLLNPLALVTYMKQFGLRPLMTEVLNPILMMAPVTP